MHNTEPVTDLVKHMSEPRTVACHVQLGEAKQGVFLSPMPTANGTFLDPVTGDCEGSVSLISFKLPCVACQADFAAHGGALRVRINSKNEGEQG